MGLDYSYSQPSSSEEIDEGLLCLLQGQADAFSDEGQSSFNNAQTVQYEPQPECDDGIPKTCYCGATPVVATSYTKNDPGRRYFTCENAHDGDCHIWKWFDVAAIEEMSDLQRQIREVKGRGIETEQKLAMVEKTVSELCEKKSGVRYGFELGVCLSVGLLVLIGLVVVLLVTGRAGEV